MANDPSTFDELAFKQMVRRAWGSECCPLQLRERLAVAQAAAEPSNHPTLVIRPAGFTWQRWGLAAAAAVALAVGLSTLLLLRTGRHAGPNPTVASIAPFAPAVQPHDPASVVPVSLEQDLVATHERCSHKADHHHLAVASDDDASIATAMRAQLSRAVLVARPADQEWRFRGAAICKVGNIPCGHLVFSKGDQAISVFSLPGSADPTLRDGDEISTVAGGHPIAGFAKDGAIFCLVASGPDAAASTAALRQMRDRMESAVTAAPPPAAALNSDARPDSDGALAELLQPITP